MKSVKPGRGPSLFGGIMGIVMIFVGIVWTIVAGSAMPVFSVFGILWTVMAVVMTIFNFRNAVGKNRFSAYDITDAEEEPDPLNLRVRKQGQESVGEKRYCPYCGAEVKENYAYCNQCGKKLS